MSLADYVIFFSGEIFPMIEDSGEIMAFDDGFSADETFCSRLASTTPCF